MRDKFVSIRLTEEEREQVRKIARDYNISIAEVSRLALQLFFTEMADREVKLGGTNR